MLKRIAAIALTAALAVGFLTSCVGSSSTSTTTTTTGGSLTSLVRDLPGLCDAVSFPLNITDLSLTGPGAATTPINASSATAPEIRINLGCLRDFTTPLNISPANAGTYDNAYITISQPQLIFYDPTILPPDPPTNTALFTLSPLKNIQVPISPSLVINKGQASVIQIDFNMLQMIGSITTNPTTGKLIVTGTPEITVTPLTASGSQGQGFGELDDLVGFVRSVTILPPATLRCITGVLPCNYSPPPFLDRPW